MGFFSFLKRKTEKKAEEPKINSLLLELSQALREDKSLDIHLYEDTLIIDTANSDFLVTINAHFVDSIEKLSIAIESREIELTYGFLVDSNLEITMIKELIFVKLREFAQAYKQFSSV